MGVAGGVARHQQGGSFMFVATTHLPDQHNLVKVPCWRWLRCCYLLDHGRQPLQDLDDAVTGEAWLFHGALQRCRTDADREQLAKDYPGLAEAHAVYTGEPPKRWELEARLLGGDASDSIAARCGIPSPV